MSEEDAIKDEGIAQGHIEEVALRMFDKADNEDRNGRFHKLDLSDILIIHCITEK